MTYRNAIKKAIVAAGFKLEDFEIHATGFEPNWAAVGLAGKPFSWDTVKVVNKQNRQVVKVAQALVAAGQTAMIYTSGHGGKFVEVNEYRHSGHDVDYCDKSSVHHY